MKNLKLYLWILFVSVTGVSLANAFFLETTIHPVLIFLISYANAVAIFGIDALVAAAIHHMNPKHFNPYKKKYVAKKWEKKFYKKIRIVDWKDYIPETGKATTGLSKSEIATTTDSEYLFHFLVETCYAETIHIWMMFVGILNFLVNPIQFYLPMLVPFFFINFFLNLPPILIQRNNRPKLLFIYEVQKKKEQKKLSEQSEEPEQSEKK